MNERKIRLFTASTAIGFAFFCMLWVVISVSLLPISEGQNDFSLVIINRYWSFISSIGLISCVFGIFTVIGICLYLKDTIRILLIVGLSMLLLGFVFEFSSLTWDTFIWPVLCGDIQYVSFVKSGYFIASKQFVIFIGIMFFLLFFGSILTSISFIRSKSFGKLIPWLLIFGIFLYSVGNFTIIYIAFFGLFIYSLAFVFIGIRLLKNKNG